MAVPNQIRIAELDYDQILTNLVDFMKADPAFADYDFSGSGLRLLARVLAYVTFYQNYYLTAAVNESFLDTAQLRSSVASHAKMLGYNIAGTQSARFYANVSVEMENTSALTVTLPKRSQFALAANSTYTFYNREDVTLTKNTSTSLYEASGVELTEGKPLTYRFTVDLTDPTQRFILPNANIDYSTIEVRVQASAASNVVTNYTKADDLLIIEEDDEVFFVQEAYSGLPEVKFGNGVVGKEVEHGNIVIVDYMVSSGEEGNNLTGPFTITETTLAGFVGGETITDDDTEPSSGGSAEEDLDNARFLAPLHYQAQGRAVTVEDYKSIILEEYGEEIAAINVFGGEQGDPNDALNRPIYGRVFVAVKPKIGLRFTDIIRKNIEDNVLKPRSIVGVIPQVIDPDYIYINVATSVRYDPRATVRTKSVLEDAIRDSILTYTQDNVEKFDTSFRFSKFIRVIDGTDDAIVSSLTRVDLEKRIFPSLGESNQFTLKFNSPLKTNSDGTAILEATSRRFTYTNNEGVSRENCFLYDEEGILHVAYRAASGDITIHQPSIGTIDYDTGLVVIENFAPTAIEGNEIDLRIRVIPSVNDFVPQLNQLFTIDPETGVQVQLLNDATSTSQDQQNFFGGILP